MSIDNQKGNIPPLHFKWQMKILFTTGSRVASLLELVYIEYLSVDRIEDFASSVSEDLLECISHGICQ